MGIKDDVLAPIHIPTSVGNAFPVRRANVLAAPFALAIALAARRASAQSDMAPLAFGYGRNGHLRSSAFRSRNGILSEGRLVRESPAFFQWIRNFVGDRWWRARHWGRGFP